MIKKLLALAAGLMLAGAAAAAVVDDVKVPDTAQVGGQKLALNGAGLREKFWVDVYVGALYLPAKASTPAAVLAAKGPNRIAMHMIYAVSKDQFVDAWDDDFKSNNPKADFAAVKDRLSQFNALFQDSKKGDVVTMDYIPGTGTQVNWNGELKGTIPGEDFNIALRRVFVGDHPPTRALKKGMLGGD